MLRLLLVWFGQMSAETNRRSRRVKKGEGIYNVVVIGAGTAGLVTAAGTAGLGGRVALIERNLMGGDCLNFGCVPSKALISSARLVQQIREAHPGFGELCAHDGGGIIGIGRIQIHVQVLNRLRRDAARRQLRLAGLLRNR